MNISKNHSNLLSMSAKAINFSLSPVSLFCFESLLKDQNNLSSLHSNYHAGIKAKQWNNQTLDDGRLNVEKKKMKN